MISWSNAVRIPSLVQRGHQERVAYIAILHHVHIEPSVYRLKLQVGYRVVELNVLKALSDGFVDFRDFVPLISGPIQLRLERTGRGIAIVK